MPVSGGYFEALGIVGRLIDDYRTTDAEARFHSLVGNIQHSSNILNNVCVRVRVCVCVCARARACSIANQNKLK